MDGDSDGRLMIENVANWKKVSDGWFSKYITLAGTNWDKLSSEDLQRINGDKFELLDRIAKRYFIHRPAAERQIETWFGKL